MSQNRYSETYKLQNLTFNAQITRSVLSLQIKLKIKKSRKCLITGKIVSIMKVYERKHT